MCEIFPIHYAPPYLANLNAVGEGEVLSVQLCVLVKGATTAAAARKRGKKEIFCLVVSTSLSFRRISCGRWQLQFVDNNDDEHHNMPDMSQCGRSFGVGDDYGFSLSTGAHTLFIFHTCGMQQYAIPRPNHYLLFNILNPRSP